VFELASDLMLCGVAARWMQKLFSLVLSVYHAVMYFQHKPIMIVKFSSHGSPRTVVLKVVGKFGRGFTQWDVKQGKSGKIVNFQLCSLLQAKLSLEQTTVLYALSIFTSCMQDTGH